MLGGNVVLLIILSMSFLVCSSLDFVVSTSHLPDVEDRYVFSMFVTEGRFLSCILTRNTWLPHRCYG